ncbi:uncharacterized protein [Onthophagus taurus]|uniref:uncharacterized protein n=1 Tax=Onthophagus taurus TaxID=166361 RepID=UPI0039BE1C09
MAKPLDISRLTQSMLTYELAVRGVSDVATVKEMRGVLRSMISLEKTGRKMDYPAHPFSFDVDLQALNEGYDEIRPLVADFADLKSSPSYRRLAAQLVHYIGRIERSRPALNTEKTSRTQLLVKFHKLRADLDSRAKAVSVRSTSAVGGVLDLSPIELPTSSEGSGSDDDDTDSRNVSGGASGVMVTPARKSIPVAKWGLTFDGSSSGLSLSAFLSQVEELRVARNVCAGELFASAYDLFSGRALVWYQSTRKRVSDWKELVELLREEFQPFDYEERLFEEIRQRTQGVSESIGMYLAVMNVFFERLEQAGHELRESVKLKLILKNLAPYYQHHLAMVEVKSLDELRRVCRQLEYKRAVVETYHPPPARSKVMETDLACMEVISSPGCSSATVVVDKVCETIQSPVRTRSSIICFNCRKELSIVFGKRESAEVNGRPSYESSKSTDLDIRMQSVLSFIVDSARGDERPYLDVVILGQGFKGLLDSGASRTILGRSGWSRLQSVAVVMHTARGCCTVANGQKCESLGSCSLPIVLRGRVRILNVLVVPGVEHELVLGVDFWRAMGIVPDLRSGEWTFCDSIEAQSTDSLSSLSDEQRRQLDDMLNDHFKGQRNGLGCTSLVKHVIRTSAEPIKQRYYPVNPIVQRHIDEELQNMLDLGVVEPSDSPWSSPILLVKKKDGSFRFCVDFRRLNGVTERDAYPIPYVSDTLNKLRNAKYLSTLDIKSAYWQIPVDENSKKFTAFTVPNRGLFQFTRMPFGLHNAPATWQRLIDQVIGADLEPRAFVYLDDIVVVTSTFQEHVETLREVLRRLRVAGLTVSREKCQWVRPELKYLGYVVSSRGLQVDPEKIKSIIELPVPKNVREVRRILGMMSWYRKFVPQFSTYTAPITDLLRKNRKFVWSPECEDSFRVLKEKLISAPILSCPDFDRPFILQTDASGYGIGAVLSQVVNGEEHVVCYLSRSLLRTERNYSTTERECLAVLWAIEKLRPYLEGVQFQVITDHASLAWLQNLRDPVGRLARWAVRLQQYDFRIIHRRGKDNVVPDALSRAVPIVDCVQIEQIQDKWWKRVYESVLGEPLKFPNWRVSDGQLYKYVESKFPGLDGGDSWKLVIPKEHSSEVLLAENALGCCLLCSAM